MVSRIAFKEAYSFSERERKNSWTPLAPESGSESTPRVISPQMARCYSNKIISGLAQPNLQDVAEDRFQRWRYSLGIKNL